MEANSRPELLTSFKIAYGDSMKNVCRILTKFCPEKSVQEIQINRPDETVIRGWLDEVL